MAIIIHIVNSATMVAALAMIYGTIQRSKRGVRFRNIALGTCFGAGAVMVMQQPLPLGPEAIIDARALFLGFAGAFLSPAGAAAALLVGAGGRLAVNISHATFVGIASMSAAVLMGVFWSNMRTRFGMDGKGPLVILGLLISSPTLLVYLVPTADGPAEIVAILALYNVVGSVVFGTIIDDQRRRARRERAAQIDAVTDPLTGLLNRRNFEQLFQAAASKEGSRGTALLLVDVDRFKRINDQFGHEVGDEVLKFIAAALRRTVRATENVLRIGGEEFAIILSDINEKDARDAAERVLRSMRIQFPVGENKLSLSVSIGMHHSYFTGVSLKKFYRAADEKLYAAKVEGRNRAVFERSAGQAITNRS